MRKEWNIRLVFAFAFLVSMAVSMFVGRPAKATTIGDPAVADTTVSAPANPQSAPDVVPAPTITPTDPHNEFVTLLKLIPGLKQGIMYDVNKKQIRYVSTTELYEYKNICLEAGYAGTDAAIIAVTYKLLALKDMGVKLPILDLVEFRPGVAGAVSRIKESCRTSWGVIATFIEVKF